MPNNMFECASCEVQGQRYGSEELLDMLQHSNALRYKFNQGEHLYYEWKYSQSLGLTVSTSGCLPNTIVIVQSPACDTI